MPAEKNVTNRNVSAVRPRLCRSLPKPGEIIYYSTYLVAEVSLFLFGLPPREVYFTDCSRLM